EGLRPSAAPSSDRPTRPPAPGIDIASVVIGLLDPANAQGDDDHRGRPIRHNGQVGGSMEPSTHIPLSNAACHGGGLTYPHPLSWPRPRCPSPPASSAHRSGTPRRPPSP